MGTRNYRNLIHENRAGFTLVELLVAVGLVGVIALMITGLSQQSAQLALEANTNANIAEFRKSLGNILSSDNCGDAIGSANPDGITLSATDPQAMKLAVPGIGVVGGPTEFPVSSQNFKVLSGVIEPTPLGGDISQPIALRYRVTTAFDRGKEYKKEPVPSTVAFLGIRDAAGKLTTCITAEKAAALAALKMNASLEVMGATVAGMSSIPSLAAAFVAANPASGITVTTISEELARLVQTLGANGATGTQITQRLTDYLTRRATKTDVLSTKETFEQAVIPEANCAVARASKYPELSVAAVSADCTPLTAPAATCQEATTNFLSKETLVNFCLAVSTVCGQTHYTIASAIDGVNKGLAGAIYTCQNAQGRVLASTVAIDLSTGKVRAAVYKTASAATLAGQTPVVSTVASVQAAAALEKTTVKPASYKSYDMANMADVAMMADDSMMISE